MNSFYKILYSNQEIVNQRRAPKWITAIVFLVSVMLIATPFVLGRMLDTPTKLVQQFEGVTPGIIDVFENYDCQVIDQNLACSTKDLVEKSVNGYDIKLNAIENTKYDSLSNNYVIFLSDRIVIRKGADILQGDYSQLEGVSFKQLLDLKQSESIDDSQLVGHFLQNINQSNLTYSIGPIYVGVVLQYIFYVIIVAVIFTFINGKKLENPLKFNELITITVLSMFTVALICAIIGLFNPVIATSTFPLAYMIRLIFVYLKLLKVR